MLLQTKSHKTKTSFKFTREVFKIFYAPLSEHLSKHILHEKDGFSKGAKLEGVQSKYNNIYFKCISLSARILHRAPPPPGSKWTKIF